MDRHLVRGVEVDHAGRRWRVHRALGPDVVLLTNDAGEIVSTAPARIDLTAEVAITAPVRASDKRRYTDDDSTPCDIPLVREEDRTVIGRPNFTVAIEQLLALIAADTAVEQVLLFATEDVGQAEPFEVATAAPARAG